MITALQFIVFTAYLIVIWKRFNIPESISHTTYKWEGMQKYYFTTMCYLLGILNLFQGMEEWGVLTSAGLFFTGITIHWMDGKVFWIHSAGAGTAIFSPLIGLLILHTIWIPLVVFLPIAMATYFLTKKPVLWIEIQAVTLILIGYSFR